MRNRDIQCTWKSFKPTSEDIKDILADHQDWMYTTRNRPPLPPHNLSDCNLLFMNLNDGDFVYANFKDAELWQIDLSGAYMYGADLSGAMLFQADLSRADLTSANLRRADLRAANLDGVTLAFSDISNANVADVSYKDLKSCRGIRADSCYGSPRFRRYVMDQDYIQELRTSGWGWLYYPWLITSNCGRSFSLWVLWAMLFAVTFAFAFNYLGNESFNLNKGLDFSFMTMLYYSVVTFTTLGFGDVTPVTTAAQMWVMAEVILGYIMLGGLISIFANKFARRAG